MNDDLILQQIREALKQSECAVKVEYCDLCNSQKAIRCRTTRDTPPDSNVKTKNQNFVPPTKSGSIITPSQYIAREWFQLQQKQIPMSTGQAQVSEIKKETKDSEDEGQQTEDPNKYYSQLVQKTPKNMNTQLATLHKSLETSDVKTPPSNQSLKLIQSAVYRNKKLAKPPLETEAVVLCRRQKQIDYGKNTEGYRCYVEAVPKNERKFSDPKTPPLRRKYSRRHWDSIVRNWRMQLHKWDPPTLNNLDLDLDISDELKKTPSGEQELKKEPHVLQQERKKLEKGCQNIKAKIRSVKQEEEDPASKKQIFSFPNNVVLDQKEQCGHNKKYSADVFMPGYAGEPRSVAVNLQNIPPSQIQRTAANNQMMKSSLTIWQQLDKIGAPFAWQQDKAKFP